MTFGATTIIEQGTVGDAVGFGGTVAFSWHSVTSHDVATAAMTTWPTGTSNVIVTLDGDIGYIYELYAYCYYVAAPVATVLAPTGTYTDRNRPTVTWSKTLDDEGGSATYYQVKVFDDAHYPANQAAITANTDYDDTSGITAGAATSWQGSVALANDTYKAYVRVAQTVNGTLHWGSWDEEEFTINVTAAPTPTLSVSDDAANARISISVNSGGATTHIIQIQRSYDGGTTWEDVRTSEGDGVISDWSATPDLYDYEAPNGTAASYRARAGRLYTDFYAYSAWTSTATDTWTSTTAYWLKHPSDPTLNASIALKASGAVERAGRVGIHQPLGEADSVAVVDQPRQATGEFEIWAATEAARAPLEALLESGDVLLFQSPVAAALDDRWIIPGGWTRTRLIDTVGYPREIYTVPWSEVSMPEGNLE